MSIYLTANELADLIGCQPNSRACMKRWLKKHGWPFVENIIGFPVVSRAYHDARMTGVDPASVAEDVIVDPDFSRFNELTPHQKLIKQRREEREAREERRIPGDR